MQACEPCRSLKVRCLPSLQGGVCKKCLRSGAECVFAEPRPRRRSSKPSSKARVSELETKLNDLIARVDQSNAGVYGITGSAPGTVEPEESRTAPAPALSDTRPSAGSSGPTSLSTPEIELGYSLSQDLYAEYPRINLTQSLPDLLSSFSISIATTDEYLLRFRNMSNYFPFVIIPSEADILSMSLDRPFLCLAALCAVTSADNILQKTLEQSFRIAILQKIMIDGERSLDLLNGLLVYLAW